MFLEPGSTTLETLGVDAQQPLGPVRVERRGALELRRPDPRVDLRRVDARVAEERAHRCAGKCEWRGFAWRANASSGRAPR